jgi:hypothetical protein
MTEPSSSYPCPVCLATADLATGCPGCGQPPDAAAAEVIRLDTEIERLRAELEAARRPYVAAMGRLEGVRVRRNALAAQVQSRAFSVRAARRAPAVVAPAPPTVVLPPKPETSTHTVQNVLFILGGLLLGSAAIVFTIVAWRSFGVAGRAAILGAVTLVALSVPPLALRSKLRATAETFAAVGLLLVLLDGYAAWYVNLAGIADRTTPTGYAGIVFAVTSLVAVAYGLATGLRGPRFAGLAAAQPVIPLFAAEQGFGATGWSLVFASVGAMDLLIALLLQPDRESGSAQPTAVNARLIGALSAAGLGGTALFAALSAATFALSTSDGLDAVARASGAMAAVAAVAALAGAAAKHRVVRHLGTGAATPLFAVAAGRLAAEYWPQAPLAAWAGVVAALGVVVLVLPAGARLGPRVGAYPVAAIVGLVASVQALRVAVDTMAAAQPAWEAALNATSTPYDWELPVAIGLVALGVALLTWRAAIEVAAIGLALVAVAVPGAVSLQWWAPSLVDGLALVPVALSAVATGSAWRAAVRGAVAAALAVHLALAALGRPSSTAVVLGALVVLSALLATLARRGSARLGVGTGATVAGVIALPAFAASLGELVNPTLRLGSAPLPLVAAGLGLAVALAATAMLARHWPEYGLGAIAGVGFGGLGVVTAAAVSATSGAPFGVFAAVVVLADLVIVLAVLGSGWDVPRSAAIAWSATLGTPAAVATGVAIAPASFWLLFAPYRWTGSTFTGAPDGVGLDPRGIPDWLAGGPFGAGPAALALAALALGVAAVGYAVGQPHGPLWTAVRAALAPGALAVLLGAVALDARWPAVALASLVIGLVATLFAAVVRAGRPPFDLAAMAVLLGGAGLAGALATRPMTLVALGAIVVTGTVCGAVGRGVVTRTVAWLLQSFASLWLALVAADAAGVHQRWTGYWILGAAAVAFGLGTLLFRVSLTRASRAIESRAVEAAAHGGALVALLLTLPELRYAAGICTLWGLAVGVRALVPGESRVSRLWRFGAAAGVELLACWLLLLASDVTVLEAYTVPLAVVAVFAGALAARANPDVRSWTAYGPGLLAGFGPSLVSAVTDGAPIRRLLVGAAAVVVVIAGSAARLRAPVVVGGVVLAVTAVHEVARSWDLLPAWVPLTVAGLLFVGIAMSYERRRNDLTRLRGAVTRMR